MEKIDDYTIEIGVVVPESKTTVRFDRGYLEHQRSAIIQQRDEYVAARNKELAEVDGYLHQCDTLGITVRPGPGRVDVQ